MQKGTRHTRAIVAGYALLLVFFGLFTGRVNLLFFGDHVLEVFSTYAHAAEIGQVGCLFLLAALAYARRSLAERIVPHCALLLLVAGYALTLYQAVGEGMAPVATAAAGALFGAGQGACFLCWFLVYARLDARSVVGLMTASTVLSGVLLLAIGYIADTALLFSVLSAVVAGSCVLVYYCLSAVEPAAVSGSAQALEPAADSPAPGLPTGAAERGTNAPGEERGQAGSDTGSGAGEGRKRFRSWFFLERRSLLCLVAIAFVCGAQRVISLEGFLPQSAVQMLFSVGYIGGAVVFWTIGRASGSKRSFYGLYSALLVVMATCGVLSSVQSVPIQAFLYAVDNVAFAIVSMFMIMTALKAVSAFCQNPLFIGGLVCGVMYFAIQLGRMVCLAVSWFIGMDAVGILIVSVIILYVVALAAISSGVFVRQAVKSGDVMEPAGTGNAEAADKENRKVIISVASVTEEQMRENPVYRRQYKLTDREIDVAVLLLAGYNATDVAKILMISVNTVKTHAKNLYAKMGVHNRRELIEALNAIEGDAS